MLGLVLGRATGRQAVVDGNSSRVWIKKRQCHQIASGWEAEMPVRRRRLVGALQKVAKVGRSLGT